MISEEHTILLVDDNLDDVELTRRAFVRNNIANQLMVVHDGEEALDYLYARGRHKDRDPTVLTRAVLLDLNLPKISGFEVLRQIRTTEATRHLPVIILTTSSEERDILDSYDLGANSYIRKPVDFAQFAESIRQLGLYWLVLNEPPPARGARP